MNRRGRPRHSGILTPREWQVLDLVEAGLTNEEIASRLGISFGTAKYHVGEIISKLGVSTREDAVLAARRTRAAGAPVWWLGWLRGRASLPVLGAAGIVAALLLISVAVFTDVLRDRATPASEGELADAAADFHEGDAASEADVLNRPTAQLSSYYYELTVSSTEPQSPQPDVRNGCCIVRVWYEAPNKWRSEYLDARTGEPHAVYVTDGVTEWQYNVDGGMYSREPDDGVIGRPLGGQLQGGSIQGYMDDEKDGPAHYWEIEGAEALLGIETVRIVQVCCRSGAVDQRMSEQRFWVDPTYNFLLRMEEKSLGTGGVQLYEVTDVQYNPTLAESVFRFAPPPGVTEVAPP